MAKTFDILCTAAERSVLLKDVLIAGVPVKQVLRSLPLFEIPIDPHESKIIPESFSDEEVSFLNDNFFLPFDQIAVEDNSGLVMFGDTSKDQRGLTTKRWFLAFCHTSNARHRSKAGATPSQIIAAKNIHARMQGGGLFAGTFSFEYESPRRFKTSIEVNNAIMLFDDGREAKIEATEEDNYRSAASDISTAVEEIIAINTPSRFVVKEQPLNAAELYREADRNKKLLRSDKRPKYTLLTPSEIKTRFGLGTGIEGAKRAPHHRRRHFRTLSSDFWTNKKGQTILIPACWVGESEMIVNDKRYKVMLDL